MKYSEFILCMKFFELELTAEETAKQLKINYKTIVLLYTEFRKYLSNMDTVTLNKFSETMKGNVGFISITLKENEVGVEFSPEKLHSKNPNIAFSRSRIANSATIYEFNFSKLRKNLNTIGNKNFSTLGTFWRFAKPRLLNFKGTDLKTLLLYLKEIEFRFNNQKEDIFDSLCLKISQKLKGG